MGVGDGILPRAKKVSTGHFFTSPLEMSPSSNPFPHGHKKHPPAQQEGAFYGVGDGIRTHECRNHNPVP